MTDSMSYIQIDAAAVKILAHPLRSRLVGQLRLQGPSTATALAKELGTNSGATSYHLRKLAEVGLVTDTGAGDGKTRVWAASAESTHFASTDFDDDEDAATAMGWLERDWLRHFTTKFGHWLDVSMNWPKPWRDIFGMNDAMILVTPEQLRAMHDELGAVIERYRRLGQGNPDAKRVAAYVVYYPLDMDKAPRR